ncbi:MAG: thioredoxin [Bacteroidetes bacterium]|nr:thioredoxin [Bacteroidota bacterium]
MKKTVLAQFLLILVLVAFNAKTFSQTAPAPAPANKAVKILTDQDFDKQIKKGITLVDFWAVWCGPCRRQAPVIDEIATEVGKKFKIGKLDVDNNKVTSNTYGVRNIPTLIIFKDGKEIKRLVGLQDKQAIMDELNAIK